jgi:hypothetical protein
MDNYGKNWTIDEENKMIALLAQTRMNSMDCDIMFANMFGRTTRAIFMRRIQIAHRLLKNGHPITYLCTLLHLSESDILSHINRSTNSH